MLTESPSFYTDWRGENNKNLVGSSRSFFWHRGGQASTLYWSKATKTCKIPNMAMSSRNSQVWSQRAFLGAQSALVEFHHHVVLKVVAAVDPQSASHSPRITCNHCIGDPYYLIWPAQKWGFAVTPKKSDKVVMSLSRRKNTKQDRATYQGFEGYCVWINYQKIYCRSASDANQTMMI